MANEPSFFERLTGGPRNEDATPQPKQVNFAENATVPQDDQPVAQRVPVTSSEKHEQWMEEAQEGQLTIDVYQTDTDIVIKSTVAGVKPEDLDIAITNDMVTIRGRRERDEEVSQDRYFYQECYWGPFSRSVILPADIDAEKADASMHNGILTIRLPKVEKEQTKKIKVKPIP